jgi:hypothetical protein
VFDRTGTLSNLTGFGDFQSVGGGVSIDPIDTLLITLNDSMDTANIDNIVLRPVAEVPDPPSMVIFATGGSGVARRGGGRNRYPLYPQKQTSQKRETVSPKGQ